MGYNVIPVLEQCEPDTEFSKTKNPNPETAEAYELALEYAYKEDADIVITTDPDCDRVAIAVPDGDGYRKLSGNELGCLLLDYILKARAAKNDIPEGAIAVRSIVSSPLADL